MAITLSRMMKKAASSVIQLANRTTYSQRKYTTSIGSSIRQVFTRRTSIPTYHHFSALAEKRSNSADDTFLNGIVDKKELGDLKVVEAPRGFPFKIVDNTEEETITLIREYQDEEIKVTVYEPEYPRDSSNDDEKEDHEDRDRPFVTLYVSVSRKGRITLEFTVDADGDGFTICRVIYPCSPYWDYPDYKEPWDFFGENLKKTFYKYLEVRGFEPRFGKFLRDYMVQRKHKLENLKSTVIGN